LRILKMHREHCLKNWIHVNKIHIFSYSLTETYFDLSNSLKFV
jgi:hypothetical protein